jgi:hypothetical protein
MAVSQLKISPKFSKHNVETSRTAQHYSTMGIELSEFFVGEKSNQFT